MTKCIYCDENASLQEILAFNNVDGITTVDGEGYVTLVVAQGDN